MNRTLNRSCRGKKRHHSRTAALAHIDRKVTAGAAHGALQPYACRHCAGHVGGRRRRS